LDGFVITGGNADGNSDVRYHEGRGGGLVVIDADPTVAKCTFEKNHAFYGGGMSCYGESSPRVVDCQFLDNASLAEGGGMHVYGASGGERTGPYVTRCVFRDNNSEQGGALANRAYASVRVMDSLFEHNSASANGGALWERYLCSSYIFNTRFSGNLAARGGAIGLESTSNSRYANSTLTGNVAEIQGGAIYVSGDSRYVDHFEGCSLYGNQAPQGDAIYLTDGGAEMANCILWNNGSEIAGVTKTLTINDSIVMGGFDGPRVRDVDPLFVDPDGPDDILGTADDDLRLSVGSPAIDAGNNALVAADRLDLDGDGNVAEPVPIDLAGNPRFAPVLDAPDVGVGSPPIVDLGAYEMPAQYALLQLPLLLKLG
jgi:hypothetical protein